MSRIRDIHIEFSSGDRLETWHGVPIGYSKGEMRAEVRMTIDCTPEEARRFQDLFYRSVGWTVDEEEPNDESAIVPREVPLLPEGEKRLPEGGIKRKLLKR